MSRSFARSLAIRLAEGDGLKAVYLPEGVEEALAADIVREANLVRPSVPPFAIMVVGSGEEIEDDALCLRLYPENAIRFRQDDRLAVVVGRHTDIASFESSFREAFGQGFPAETGDVSIPVLSLNLLSLVLAEAGVASTSVGDSDRAAERLANCLSQLVAIYEEQRDGTLGWQAQWFKHVELGVKKLENILKFAVSSTPGSDLDSLLERMTYASFGLPRPTSLQLTRASLGRAFAEAIAAYWADGDLISTTASQLVHHPDTDSEPHPLSELDWSRFDQSRAAEDSFLLAWLGPVADVDRTNAMAALTERQFFDPLLTASNSARIQVLDEQDRLCAIDDSDASQSVMITSAFEDDQGKLRFRSEPVRIRVPLLAEAPENTPFAQSVKLKLSSSKLIFIGTSAALSKEALEFVGRFESRGKVTHDAALVQSKLTVICEGPVASFVNTKAWADLILLPPTSPALLFGRVDKKGGVRSPAYAGPALIGHRAESQPEIHTATLPDESATYTLVLHSADDGVPLLNGREMDVLHSRPGVFRADLSPSGADQIVVPSASFALLADRPDSAHQSPIVAAIMGELVEPDLPMESTQASVRGLLDVALGNLVVDNLWRESLGHCILPSDLAIDIADVSDLHNGVQMPRALADIWEEVADFKVPSAVSDSDAARRFRSSFDALEIAETLQILESDGTSRVEWISRTSWRHLISRDRSRLDEYLNAYTELIAHARLIGDPAGIMWATYPFSASIWDTASGRCRALILSPLHPLRLGWCAAAEATLWDSTNASGLAGVVEGWNFPILGVRESANGRMIAVPTDNGEKQVFIGWSMLLEASIDGHEALSAPDRIGDRQAPGTAASGLNATAVTSALRAYRNMNPQVSTLTLDLAASNKAVRLDEIDAAVLSLVREWADGGDAELAGGSRVFDSLNRTGEPPRDEAIRLARTLEGTPFVWSRYLHKAGASKPSNVRLLQDSGVRAEVGVGGEGNLGILAGVPLRRYEAQGPGVGVNGLAVSRPALRNEQGWGAFAEALIAAESGISYPTVSTKLSKSLLVDLTADWTVSGETMMGPSAMSSLLAESNNGQKMLWEWRPPILKPFRGVPALERRPFVSVARVPTGFRSQIRGMLEKATKAEVTEKQVSDLLGTLGSRGVGLSSLLSMGGTHASGALGFYLAFSLMQRVESETADRFVLPIDACESFLSALSMRSTTANSTRRADLLVCELRDDELVMSPVEIKFYGFDGAMVPNLPTPTQSSFTEALDQLDSTATLLRSIRQTRESLPSWSDRALWSNGLAALIDAGARLRPADSANTGKFADRFQRLANGELAVTIGRPVVAYFRYESMTAAGEDHALYTGELSSGHPGMGEFGSLVANTEASMAAIAGGNDEIVAAWGSLIEWSLVGADPTVVSENQKIAFPEVSLGYNSADAHLVEEHEPVSTAGESGGGTEVLADPGRLPDQHSPHLKEEVGNTDLEPTQITVGDPSVPVSLEGVKFDVGQMSNSVGGAQAAFWPSNTALNQLNVGVVGDLGTGKTQLLKSLILNLRQGAAAQQAHPLSFLIFDYKRDFQDEGFIAKVGGHVLAPLHIPLNIFALSGDYTPLKALQKANFLYDVLSKIYTGVGPVQRDRLVTAVTSLYKEANGVAPTLSAVLARYREGTQSDAITSILNTFVLGEIFSEDPAELKTFKELIDDRVLVVALSDLGADSNAKNALVVLFLNLYYEYMLASTKWPYSGENPQLRQLNSFLLVDEAVNIMRYNFQVLNDLMLQGREFGFGIILASQYLSHFKNSGMNYGEPLLTWFIHKVPKVSAKELDQLGIPAATDQIASRVGNLNVHEALYSSLGFKGVFIRGTPYFELP